MAGQNIDRDKLRAAIRKMGTEYVFLMLDDAITLLPQRKLRKLIAQHLDPDEFRPDGTRKVDLLGDVKAFQKASLAGKYYQAFAVNSKNYREKSGGTLAWIADCLRLLIGTTDGPEHSGAFESGSDEGFATRFNHP